MDTKSPFASKLNYVGLLLVAWPEIEPLLKELLPDSIEGSVVRLIGIGIIVLRTWFTSHPVAVKP